MRLPTSQNLSDTASALGLLAAVFVAIRETLALGVVLAGLAAVAFIGSLMVRRRESRIERSALDSIGSELSPDRVLDAVARHLALGGRDGGWRLSLYELDVAEEEWVLRARASSNELFADHRDMPRLPPNRGVLRSCLAGSEQPLGRFDEMPALPAPPDQAWFTTMEAWGVPPHIAKALRMKSRSYCGSVFKVGKQDGHQTTLGIVAESEAPEGVDVRTLESGLTRPFFESLAELVLLSKSIDGFRNDGSRRQK